MKGMAFSAEMAQAIYEGRKTQIRRVMKPQPPPHTDCPYHTDVGTNRVARTLPYSIGERLYVQEPFIQRPTGGIFYKGNDRSGLNNLIWRLAKTMSQPFARSIIEITAIRAERLQDITEEDAKAEGATMKIDPLSFDSGTATCTYRYGFYDIWQNLYHDHPVKGWKANPWVFVYGVERVEGGK